MQGNRSFFLASLLSLISLSLQEEVDLLEVAGRLAKAATFGISNYDETHYRNFGNWTYEGALITRGLWELQHTFPELGLEEFLDSHLDFFIDTPTEYAYRILQKEDLVVVGDNYILPWHHTPGDIIGLFPVVYADRVNYGSGTHQHPDDLTIMREVVEKYIYPYPWPMPDGSGAMSRPNTWEAEGGPDMRGGGVWADDMYMGTGLLISYSLISEEMKHLEYAGNQLIQLGTILQDPYTKLMKHGYWYWTDHHSCCYWGRGNGWSIVAFSEFLAAADKMNFAAENEVMYTMIIELFNTQLHALLELRTERGLWTNVLMNSEESYLETSASAMFTLALARGYRNGWIIDDMDYTETILGSWDAILNTIQQDGTVVNIQPGTGIKNNETLYTPTETNYENSGPGVGWVLRLTAEMVKFNEWIDRKHVLRNYL